jgi:hypothetical protein
MSNINEFILLLPLSPSPSSETFSAIFLVHENCGGCGGGGGGGGGGGLFVYMTPA